MRRKVIRGCVENKHYFRFGSLISFLDFAYASSEEDWPSLAAGSHNHLGSNSVDHSSDLLLKSTVTIDQ